MLKNKILIVDDEEDFVQVVKMRLEFNGFEVSTANDGKEGLQKAREEFPNLIILDAMLPSIDGFKICKLLKFDEKYQNIPVVMLSALSQDMDRTMGLQSGADKYLTKPFNDQELLEVINSLL
ncbi:response regulator [bacterium]|jgi:two-component system, OmpR family, alkaline phosphatase synthesis response regulator PhoP|nr:response regulator [bacterium]